MKKRLSLGQFTVHPEYDVPVIEVLVDNEVGGYLSPFREYYFQVSKTYDGVTDLGHSIYNISSLRDLVVFGDQNKKTVFKALAFTALYDFVRVYKVHTARANKDDGDDLVIDIKLNPIINQQDNFDDFIAASVRWVDTISR